MSFPKKIRTYPWLTPIKWHTQNVYIAQMITRNINIGVYLIYFELSRNKIGDSGSIAECGLVCALLALQTDSRHSRQDRLPNGGCSDSVDARGVFAQLSA